MLTEYRACDCSGIAVCVYSILCHEPDVNASLLGCQPSRNFCTSFGTRRLAPYSLSDGWKLKKWIGISVDVKTIADFQIGRPLRNKNRRKSCATMPSFFKIFLNTIGGIDDSTPSSWSLFVKPKLIEIFKVFDWIQAIGNATGKISFSLSSKDSRKCLGTVKLLATALVVLLIGCSSGMFKNSRAKLRGSYK